MWDILCHVYVCYRRLLDRGMTATDLDQLLERGEEDQADVASIILNEPVPHMTDSQWFVKGDRNFATDLLQNKPDGTFLVRPRDSDTSFALSVV